MALIYKPFQSSLENKEHKRLFYPRVVLTGNVDTDRIAREIAGYSSLSSGDVKNTLDNLVTVMAQHLQASESVTLDGFGTFRLSMSSSGRGVETADEVNASQATVKIVFTPAYTRNTDGKVATRSMVTGVKCVRVDQVKPSDDGTGGTDEDGDDSPLS